MPSELSIQLKAVVHLGIYVFGYCLYVCRMLPTLGIHQIMCNQVCLPKAPYVQQSYRCAD